MEWKSAVTCGLKWPALLKKIETVMWRTSLTNMAQVLDYAYTEYKQRQNLYVHTFFTFTAAILAAILIGFAYVVRHQGQPYHNPWVPKHITRPEKYVSK